MGVLPDATEAVNVTSVPQVAVVATDPPVRIASEVVEATCAERIMMGIRVVAESVLEVPVIVAAVVPAVVVLAARSVSVLAEVDDAELQLAVTPAGNPEIEKLTLPLKPFIAVTVTVELPEPPGKMFITPGTAESVKYGANTLSTNVAVAVIEPEVPVIVTV